MRARVSTRVAHALSRVLVHALCKACAHAWHTRPELGLMATVVTVANMKGGTGKTTSAVALATAAARRGHDVVVVDVDPQASAVAWAAEAGGLGYPVVRARKNEAARAIRHAAAEHDLVIVDTPPGESDLRLVQAAAEAADVVVVPVAPSGLEVHRTLDALAQLERWHAAAVVLVVRTNPRTVVHRQLVEALDDDDTTTRLEAVIPATVRLAAAFGETLDDPALHGYLAAFDELAQHLDLPRRPRRSR